MNVIAHTVPARNVPLGIGYYTVPEAARLLGVSPRSVNRWLGGYAARTRRSDAEPPLWRPELPAVGNRIELGFRDLVELRFVHAFLQAGLTLPTIRDCIAHARDRVDDDRPFSTRRFRTDGRAIFLEVPSRTGGRTVADLTRHRSAVQEAIERTFRDLDIADDAVVRWRPFQGRKSIVIDPTRAFGQPIATAYGIPTVALAEAAEAEGSPKRAALLYDVPPHVVRDAVQFEASL